MFKVLIYLVFSLVSVNALLHESSYYANKFAAFEKEYGKKYADEAEFNKRLEIFSTNVDKIEKFNSEKHSYKMGITQFADLTDKEFKEKYLTNVSVPDIKKTKHIPKKMKDDEIPERLDWREAGIMSPVEHQHECGGCWSFAALEVLQAVHALNGTHEPTHLSKQQLIDCARGVGINNGCDGGNVYYAYEYTQNQKVLCTEDEYEYLNRDFVCALESTHCTYRNYQTDYQAFGGEVLTQFMIIESPLAISIDASNLNLYKSGIVSVDDCPDPSIQNHAVVLAGYGTENGMDYWLIKNSWGSDWGENGYFRLERNGNNPGEGACAIGCYVVGMTIEHNEINEIDGNSKELIISIVATIIEIVALLLCYFTGCCYYTRERCCCCCCWFGKKDKYDAKKDRHNGRNIDESIMKAADL